VFRPSEGIWYYLQSSNQAFRGIRYGSSTDIPSPGDYDGDGKSDFAVFRPTEGIWFIMQSSNGITRTQFWGSSGDVPLPATNVP